MIFGILCRKLFYPTFKKKCSIHREVELIQTLKGQNNFCYRILFNLLLEVPIQSIEMPIGTNNGDVGTYRNKLKMFIIRYLEVLGWIK